MIYEVRENIANYICVSNENVFVIISNVPTRASSKPAKYFLEQIKKYKSGEKTKLKIVKEIPIEQWLTHQDPDLRKLACTIIKQEVNS